MHYKCFEPNSSSHFANACKVSAETLGCVLRIASAKSSAETSPATQGVGDFSTAQTLRHWQAELPATLAGALPTPANTRQSAPSSAPSSLSATISCGVFPATARLIVIIEASRHTRWRSAPEYPSVLKQRSAPVNRQARSTPFAAAALQESATRTLTGEASAVCWVGEVLGCGEVLGWWGAGLVRGLVGEGIGW
jgi:hypothetical protein